MKNSFWVCAGLVLLTLVLYGRTLGHEFVSLDDEAYIVGNPHVQGGLTAAGVRWAWTTMREGNYHPLTWISHMLDTTLFALRPGGHHATSVLLHAASAVLLFLAFRSMTGEIGPSAFVAALFAVHPLRVESVAWASERKDVLSGFFFMLVLLAYARYARRPRPGAYAAVVVLFAAGLLAKSMLVTVPCVLLLLDRWPLARCERRADLAARVREKLPLFALSLASCGITLVAQRGAGVVGPMDALPLASRLANAATSYASYLRKTILPTDLACFYPIATGVRSWTAPLLSALLLLAASLLAIRGARRFPYLALGWFWYLGMLVPVIGLVQVGTQAMADRYAYLPTIGIYVALAWSLRDLARSRSALRSALVATGCASVAVLAVFTWFQVGTWRNSRTLFEHALRVIPESYVAHNGLGIERARAGDLADAAAHFASALATKPDYTFAQYNLGVVLLQQGRIAEGETRLREALRLDPRYADAHFGLALVLESRGARAEAVTHLEEALRLAPDLQEARQALQRIAKEKDGQVGRPSP